MDKNYRGRIGKKILITDLMSAKVFKSKNKEHSWENREYPEFDDNFICISKDGTLGEIFLIDNLYVGLPSQTIKGKDVYTDNNGNEVITYFDKEILNDGLTGKQAKWKRDSSRPVEFEDLWFEYKGKMANEKAGTKRQIVRNDFVRKRNKLVKENIDYIDLEFNKRKHGIFVKIDNDIHYLTGSNWMFLEHYYLTESDIYPNFRLTQTEAYWHWEACVADTRCWGEMRGKGRRTSWSVESSSLALDMFTKTKYAKIPIVSERKDLAQELFIDKIVKSFEYYPIYFKPLIILPNDEPQNTLSITHETKRRESGKITYYPTKTTAYDSTKVKFLSINDEIGKWLDESLIDFVSRHSKCHTEGNGKGRFGSTAGEYFKGGGEEFEIEYKSADPQKRNSITGRTENGLVNFFIDICYTMTEPMNFFDEWGYSIVHDPEEPILNEFGKIIEVGAITFWNATFDTLKKAGEKKKLNGFLRDAPRKIEHMFRNEGGVNNDFDIDNLNNHADYLNGFTHDMLAESTIFRGNLAFKGEKFNSDVEWIPHPKGKFKTTWIPDPDRQNKFNEKEFHGKKINMPDNDNVGNFGVDSYDIIGNTGDGNGSDGAIAGYSKFNMVGCPSHSFFMIYKERPDQRNDFYDDVIMACQFWGMSALVESNKARLLEYMYDNGYTGYALRRQDKKWKDLHEAEKIWGGIPSSTPVIEDQANLLKTYIFNNIGGDNLSTDCKVWFSELIKEWTNFNLQKRKLFDLGVASGMAIMGSQYRVKKRKVFKGIIKGGVSKRSFSA
ncbi:MAG: hypothetical protein QM499_00945 [Flavobacteriaceae bacterium]